jgi:hypothetical protein
MHTVILSFLMRERERFILFVPTRISQAFIVSECFKTVFFLKKVMKRSETAKDRNGERSETFILKVIGRTVNGPKRFQNHLQVHALKTKDENVMSVCNAFLSTPNEQNDP